MNRLTNLLFVLGVMLALPSAMRAASVVIDVDQLTYIVDTDTGEAELYGPISSSTRIVNLTIPDFIEYNGDQYPVTSIGNYAFFSKNVSGSLTIGNSVTTVGDYAFSSCSGFTGSLTIGNSVTTIGDSAFSSCSGFTGSLTIPNSVTTIGDEAFSGCRGFTGSLTIGNSVTTIGQWAFLACSGFTGSLTIGNSVTTIGDSAFSGCNGFTGSLTIPNSVTTIGQWAFDGCSGFTGTLTIGNSVITIGYQAFYACSGFTGSLTIPNSVTTIGGRAFIYCSGFTGSLTIGNSVTTIGDSAFSGCKNLTSIKTFIDGEQELEIDSYAFSGCTSLISAELPNTLTSIGSEAFSGCSALSSITFVDGEQELKITGLNIFDKCPLKNIYIGRNLSYSKNNYAPFNSNTSLVNLTIGNKVTKMNAFMFADCTGLTTVKFIDGEEELRILGEDSFRNCPIESIYIGRDITYQYNNYAPFNGITTLKELVLGETVKTIDSYAFAGCTKISSVIIPSSVMSIGEYSFYNCSALTSIEIPEAITEIKEYTFSRCSGMGSVKLGSAITQINKGAFSDCSNLTDISIPIAISIIHEAAFSGCTTLSSLIIEDTKTELKFLGEDSFRGCAIESLYLGRNITYPNQGCAPFKEKITLKNLVIGDEVSAISDYSFTGCTGLSTLSFSNSMLIIGESAFSECSGLASLELSNSITEIKASAFSGCSELTSIEIPSSVISLYSSAFSNCSKLKSVKFADGEEALSVLGSNLFYRCPVDNVFLGRNLSYSNSDYAPFKDITSLKSVKTGDAVTTIGASSFYGCSGLTTIDFSNSIENIQPSAFSGCTALESVVIPNSVITLGASAFYGCIGLTYINIPNSVNFIDSSAFSGCSALTTINIIDGENNLEITGSNSFNSCPIEDLYQGRNIIYNSASYAPFKGITTLKSLVIGDNVTEIGESAYSGCSKIASIKIPDSVNEIASNAFAGCTGLVSLELSNSMCNIGSSAFLNCSGISSLNIPNSVTSIGSSAFSGCTGISVVRFDDGEKELLITGVNSFKGCPINSLYLGRDIKYSDSSYAPFRDGSNLNALTISNSVTAIGTYAFNNCPLLTDIEIPNSVISIEDSAFGQCSGLTSLTLGDSVNEIGESAFGSSPITTIYSKNQIPANIYLSSFSGFSKKECTVYIPIKTISDYKKKWSMFNCFIEEGNSLSKTYIIETPGTLMQKVSVSEINNITSLKLIGKINGTDILTLNRMEYLLNLDLSEATIVSGGMPYYEEDNNKWDAEDNTLGENWCYNLKNLTNVNLPLTLEKIGDYALSSQNRLKEITIPSTVTSISNYAFNNCTALADVVLTDGNQQLYLGSKVFNNCPIVNLYLGRDLIYSDSKSPTFANITSIETLRIGNNVSSINVNSFRGCRGIYSINILDGETVLNLSSVDVFSDCPINTLYLGRNINYSNTKSSPFKDKTRLSNLTLGEGLTNISPYMFSGCTGVSTLIVPNSVTSIGENSFYGCSRLSELYLGNSLTSIGSSAFAACNALTSPNFPNSLLTIDNSAFSGCKNITDIVIPNSVKIIGKGVFYNCSGLTAVELSNSVSSLGASAFEGCTSLKEAKLSLSLTEIPERLCYGCSSLESINVPDPVRTIGALAFTGCSALTEVTLPGSLRKIGNSAFAGCDAVKNINCINPIPAVIESNTYSSAMNSSATLNVPDGSMALYWIHPYWGKFENIKTWIANTEKEFVEESITYHVTSEEDATVEVTASNLVKTRGEQADVEIPAEVTFNGKVYRVAGIANNGFENCQLTSISLPSTVGYVGIEAFKGCSDLKHVTCLALLPPSVNNNSFDENTYGTAALSVPEDVVDTYKNDAVWSLFDISAVNTPVSSITLDPSEYRGIEGDTFTIKATVYPADATNQTLVWSSSDEKVATVTQEGVVTIIKPGMCVITASATDGSEIKATCEITAEPAVTLVSSITLDPNEVKGVAGDTFKIAATVYPLDATNQTLAWSSSDENIATVTQEGVVTIIKPGMCVITASATDGSDIKAMCEISSTSEVDSIEQQKDGKISIFTISGVCLFHNESKDVLKKLSPGVYIVREGSATRKIIVN